MKYPTNRSYLPAWLRFDPQLPDFEKILLGEVLTLKGKNECCWASDSHFAFLFNKSTKTIYRALKKLVKSGFIEIRFNPNKNNRREIFILNQTGTGLTEQMDINDLTSRHSCPENNAVLFIGNKNDKLNEVSEGNTPTLKAENSTNYSFKKGAAPSLEQVKVCMLNLASEATSGLDIVVEAKRFYNHYTANGWMIGKVPMINLNAAINKWLDNAPTFNLTKNSTHEHYRKFTFKQSPYTHLHAKQYDDDKF